MNASNNSPPPRIIWAWMLPVSYLCHLIEEYFGGVGFPQWFSQLAGIHFTKSDFLILNTIALSLVILGTALAISLPRLRFIFVALATVFSINGSLHIITSLATKTYSPGVLTGLLIWLPLGFFVLHTMRMNLSRQAFRSGILVGFGLHVVLVIILFTSSK